MSQTAEIERPAMAVSQQPAGQQAATTGQNENADSAPQEAAQGNGQKDFYLWLRQNNFSHKDIQDYMRPKLLEAGFADQEINEYFKTYETADGTEEVSAKGIFDAFAEGWIDSPPHAGKVGGAYCTSFPIAKESRVMCNYSPQHPDQYPRKTCRDS